MKIPLVAFILFFAVSFSEAQVMNTIDLSGKWDLTWNEGGHGPSGIETFLRSDPLLDPARFIKVQVPQELHLAMEKAGLSEDINFGINSLKARWVAEKYWLYVKRFTVPEEATIKKAWLVFDQLDLNAVIMLNGNIIGKHNSVFIPCRIDITGKLRAGENLLQVGLESGLYEVAEKEGKAYNEGMATILNKRHWLRKPQYQFLWDWNPQLINVGITGPVRLEWTNSVRLDQVSVHCSLSDDLSRATLFINTFLETPVRMSGIRIRTTVKESGETNIMNIDPGSGTNRFVSTVEVHNPKLWWPAGQGPQNLYNINIEVLDGESTLVARSVRTGIRSIRIDQSPHPSGGNYFTMVINNRKVFMKGGDWVPPEMIYSNVSKARLDTLTDLAVRANFNILRIWGGAIWAGHDLLDLCDEKGLLVWHDLLFACSKYPADNKEFLDLVKEEVRWGVREFSPHPSLAVWCGNNENELGTYDWGWELSGRMMPDYGLYHLVMPLIVKEEDPSRPYWPSSPYSPDNLDPNSPITGDQHPWEVSLGEAGPDFRAYRNYVDRFPNEGGVLGASSPATLKEFLPRSEQSVRSFSWDYHDNEVNFWSFDPGLSYKLTQFWIGKKAEDLGFDKYPLASGLIQAEGLIEYISNYRRRMFSSSSAIFWMFDDSWPVTNGWTIVDYYLRKKLAYHPVRRAFEPVVTVAAIENDSVKIFGINDRQVPWTGTLRYGIFKLGGGYISDYKLDVTLPPNCSVFLAGFPEKTLADSDPRSCGAFTLLVQNGKTVSQHRIFTERFKDLIFSRPQIKITRAGETVSFMSDVFVWGACIDLNGEEDIPDNCFDLLPGVPYSFQWTRKELPRVLFTGNSLF